MGTPGTSLYVNADWSALVPAGSPEAAFGLDVETAKRLGLLPLEDGEALAKPVTIASANVATAEVAVPDSSVATSVEPEPAAEPEDDDEEAKEADKPADKARRKPRTK